jgi:hypothetical protein
MMESSYELAKKVKDGMKDLVGTKTTEAFAEANKLVDTLMLQKSDEFLAKKRLNVRKLIYENKTEKARQKQEPVNDLVDKIANTTDPAEQKELIEELEDLQSSGQLKNAIVAKAEIEDARGEYEEAERSLGEMRKRSEQHEKRLLEIAKQPTLKRSDLEAFRVNFQANGVSVSRSYRTLQEARTDAYAFIKQYDEPGGFFTVASIIISDGTTGKFIEQKNAYTVNPNN